MSENENKKDKKGGVLPEGGKPNPQIWIIVAVLAAMIAIFLFSGTGSTVSINEKRFEEMLNSHDIKKLLMINGEVVEITLKPEALENDKYKEDLTKKKFLPMASKDEAHYSLKIVNGEIFNNRLKELQKGFSREDYVPLEVDRREGADQYYQLLFLVLMLVLFWFLMRRMTGAGGSGSQIFNIGKSRAQLFDKSKNVNVTFEDVAGLEGPKIEVQEIVDFLKNPAKYTDLGAKIPKGALLVGPPGTGKTLLAKAVAGEAQVPFYSLSGSDFVEMFVGVGASRVRDLFKQAKAKAPAIIFIDEIDAIGRARGKSLAQGGNDERENTLNQLLTEMDGFGTNSGVIIMAATNRADVLDRALLRAGRFDRQIHVDLPELVERKEIFEVHLKPLKLDTSVDSSFLAKQTPGFSGADIANICNEAALIAARKKKNTIGKQDFLDAVDRIIGGLEKKNKIITQEEKNVIAYHEAGHATVSWLLEHAAPLVKVTIVPRGQSLGAAWYLPEERQITTEKQLLDEMCATLGGRAAEQVMFGEISTGALSDLEKVTKQALAMVTVYGLNDKLGNISYYDSTGQSEYSMTKPYSEKTAELIDSEVSGVIETSYQRALELLGQNKDKLSELAQLLIKKEVIFAEDLERIFGPRPFPESARQRMNREGLEGVNTDKTEAASKPVEPVKAEVSDNGESETTESLTKDDKPAEKKSETESDENNADSNSSATEPDFNKDPNEEV